MLPYHYQKSSRCSQYACRCLLGCALGLCSAVRSPAHEVFIQHLSCLGVLLVVFQHLLAIEFPATVVVSFVVRQAQTACFQAVGSKKPFREICIFRVEFPALCVVFVKCCFHQPRPDQSVRYFTLYREVGVDLLESRYIVPNNI